MSIIIETTIGDMTIDLFVTQRPKVAFNFLKLCKMKYYNFNLFHSIQSDFIAQTGDPTGKGTNGQSIFSYIYGNEAKYFHSDLRPNILHNQIGLISMVNCGDNMFGSQFFITLGSELQSLDNKHCVFGQVIEGMDVLNKLNETICDHSQRPFRDIRITHTIILEDPFLNPPNILFPENSPEPTRDQLLTDRIAADEEIEDDKTMEEIEEKQLSKEAKAQATILEMVGDIPHAEIAPPENVLFVCKLNPLTKEEDLEIIFNRFGKINSCEVIKDETTGNSLQYAFIEFDQRKSCEDAYFKMDNVLIDDRRIHVDFSQSVAKYKWRGKGRGVEHINTEENNTKDNTKSRDSKSKSFKYEQNKKDFSKRHNQYNSERPGKEKYIDKIGNRNKSYKDSYISSKSNDRQRHKERHESRGNDKHSNYETYNSIKPLEKMNYKERHSRSRSIERERFNSFPKESRRYNQDYDNRSRSKNKYDYSSKSRSKSKKDKQSETQFEHKSHRSKRATSIDERSESRNKNKKKRHRHD